MSQVTQMITPQRKTLGVRHLLSVDDLSDADIQMIMDSADSFLEISERPIKKVPALRGKTVGVLFFEPSTRTRISFELAAKRLSADVVSVSSSGSSVEKGESLKDTVRTLECMGVDALVVRHPSPGAPYQVTTWSDSAVLNAGDGAHQHPTQALLDLHAIRGRVQDLKGKRLLVVGDIRFSRVARSTISLLQRMGMDVVVCGPPTLLPPDAEAGMGCRVSYRLDDELPEADVVYLLRMQFERQDKSFIPTLAEYKRLFSLTTERQKAMKDDAVILHPGPMNRGIEIGSEVVDHPRTLIEDQVRSGLAVRMSLLYLMLGGEEHAASH